MGAEESKELEIKLRKMFEINEKFQAKKSDGNLNLMSTMLFAAEKVNQTNLFPKKQISNDILSGQRHLEVFRVP